MENTMINALKALTEQVGAGFSPKSETAGRPGIDRPINIGDLFARAEAARDELRHAGFSR